MYTYTYTVHILVIIHGRQDMLSWMLRPRPRLRQPRPFTVTSVEFYYYFNDINIAFHGLSPYVSETIIIEYIYTHVLQDKYIYKKIQKYIRTI